MIAAVADTHAAIWYLLDDPRLTALARSVIDEARISRRQIAISSISLAELVYLVEKLRLPLSAYDELRRALADSEHVFTEAVFDGEVVQAMRQILRSEVPDMPDRIVAATALHLGVPIISRDRKIRISSVTTIW